MVIFISRMTRRKSDFFCNFFEDIIFSNGKWPYKIPYKSAAVTHAGRPFIYKHFSKAQCALILLLPQ